MESNIFKIGNSLGVRIPKTFASELGLNKGDKVEMTKENNAIRIMKSEETSLEELFKDYDDYFETKEIDWYGCKGDENVWTEI